MTDQPFSWFMIERGWADIATVLPERFSLLERAAGWFRGPRD